MKKIFRIFESCILTRGYGRSLITDFHRQKSYLIPNSLADLCNNNIINAITLESEADKEIFDGYIDFLIENELGFFIDENQIDNFARINKSWDSYSSISNIIMEFHTKDKDFFFSVLNRLESQNNTHLSEIHFINPLSKQDIDSIFNDIAEMDIDNMNLILSLDKDIDIEYVKQKADNDPRIYKVIVYSYGIEKMQVFKSIGGNIFVMPDVFSYSSCGVINQLYFANTISHITESYNHNTCLNRKISVDRDGNVRNCPNMSDMYGNIFLHDISDILKHKDIEKYWHIRKDDIEVCRDCEYRHICTDCRAFLLDENLYSKPIKCSYDPYKNKWSNSKDKLLTKFNIVNG